MNKKLFKWSLLGGSGLAVISLIGSLGLMALNSPFEISNLIPSIPQENKNLNINQQSLTNDKNNRDLPPQSDDLEIERDYVHNNGWRVNGLTKAGRNKQVIVIPSGITIIGGFAFMNDESLKTVVIPNSVISIGEGAFTDCSNLYKVTIPSSVKSIKDTAFKNDPKLLSGSLANYSTVLFDWWVENKRVDGQKINELSALDFSKLKNDADQPFTTLGDGAFEEDTNLQTITNWGEITNIGSSAFTSCTNLNLITIPETVKFIGAFAFYGISKSAKLTNKSTILFDWWVENKHYDSLGGTIKDYITKQGGVLKKTDFAKFLNDNRRQFSVVGEYCFSQDTSLKTVDLPDSITVIDEFAFHGCKQLTTITLPENLTMISTGCFEDCSSLNGIKIPNRVKAIGAEAFFGCKALSQINLPETLEVICSMAFDDTKITSITIPENVNVIGEDLFADDRGVPKELQSVKILGNSKLIAQLAFRNIDPIGKTQYQVVYPRIASILNTVCEIPAEQISLLSKEEGDFFVYNHTAIALSQRGKNEQRIIVTADLQKIEVNVFCDCSKSLDTIIIENKNTVIDKPAIFAGVSSQTVYYVNDHEIADQLSNIGISKAKIYLMSENQGNLIVRTRFDQQEIVFVGLTDQAKVANQIEIPNNISRIDDNAFSNCSRHLSDIIFDTNNENLVIRPQAFNFVPKATNYLVNNQTVAKELEKVAVTPAQIAIADADFYYGFADETNIFALTSIGKTKTELTIPATVKKIKKGTFSNCNEKLNKITIFGTDLSIDSAAFTTIPKTTLANMQFYVYSISVRDLLKNQKINSDHIHLVLSPTPGPSKTLSGLSLKSIGIIVSSICAAILILGLGIGLPMRKQNKISMLQVKLNGKRIENLSTTNTMAIKKIVEVAGNLDQQMKMLSIETKTIKTAVPQTNQKVNVKSVIHKPSLTGSITTKISSFKTSGEPTTVKSTPPKLPATT